MEAEVANYVPEENETIAIKRTARIADKLMRSRGARFAARSWWSGTVVEVCFLIAIIILNLMTIWQFLGTATPNTAFSGPVVPLLAKMFWGLGFEFRYGLQLINVFFTLGLYGTMYLLVRNVTGRKMVAYLSVLVASLPVGLFADARVRMSFAGQDTPHIISLTVSMVAISVMLGFLRKGGVWRLVVNVIVLSVVGLMSPTGFLSLLVFTGVTVFSEMLLGSGRLKVSRAIMVIALAVGLSSFWYSPGFLYWLVMGAVGAELRGVLAKLIPISMFAVPLLAIFGFLLFDRKPGWQPFFLALFYSVGFLAMVLAGGGKFLAETGLAVAFLSGVIIVKLFDYVRGMNVVWLKAASWAGVAVIVLGCLGAITLARDKTYEDDFRVLGVWTDVEKDHIWIKRDEFMKSPLSYLGTMITSVTVIAMLGMTVAANKKATV